MAKTKKKPFDAEISRAEALELVCNYKSNRYGEQDSTNYSQYAEFDLWLLVEFLQRMRVDHGASRVRIYYGAREVHVNSGSKEMTYGITPVIVTTRSGIVPEYNEIFTSKKGVEGGALAPESGFDFASLCPPDQTHISRAGESIAYDVYVANQCLDGRKKKKK